MTPSYDRIPEELRALPNWVVWRTVKRAGRDTKAPFNARSDELAKSNDPSTWSPYDVAVAALKRGYNGLGFCLSPPYVGIDLDGCMAAQTCETWADRIIKELNSYSELSPSGRGVHVIVRGALPDGPRQMDLDGNHHGVGLYDSARGRYLTMTGAAINGGIIHERTAELCAIHARLFPPQKRQAAPKPSAAGGSPGDDDLIARARMAFNGAKFSRLWDGNWENDYISQSEADLALCMMLAFWTDRDAVRIDALFRRSALMRDKWERADYREATIGRAVGNTDETYRAAKPKPRTYHVRADALTPSIELLNACMVLQERVRFVSVQRRASMIIAQTDAHAEIIWPSISDLITFARSRSIIADATNVILPTPPKGKIEEQWHPFAELILKLAAKDCVMVDPGPREEFREILPQVWRKAGKPIATDGSELIAILEETKNRTKTYTREFETPPARCAVFLAEGSAWVYLPALREYLATPGSLGRHYEYVEVRNALLLLGFKSPSNGGQTNRSHAGKSIKTRVWIGPKETLDD